DNQKMEYYIEPAEQTPEVRHVGAKNFSPLRNPEDITFFDPACGSGHILVEAYDILKEIYLERGYRTRDIPKLILAKNLYGLDICDRAAQLAGFAVLMKARADDRKILQADDLKMHIHAIQASRPSDLRNIDLFFKGDEFQTMREDLRTLADLFENAKTFGSLITIPEPIARRMPDIAQTVEDKIGKWVAESDVHNLRALVAQAALLAKKFDCVVTNPPYMGGKGMNPLVKGFLKDHFTDVKSDLFSAFIVRNTDLTKQGGQLGFMSPFVWMFISSYEKLRNFLIDQKTITSLIQLEYSGFDGATVPICTFTLENTPNPNFKGGYIRLSDFRGAENQAPRTLEAIQNPACGWFFHASAADFKKIPGSPIAYWVSDNVRKIFVKGIELSKTYKPIQGLITGDTERFAKVWHEVSRSQTSLNAVSEHEAETSNKKWFPYNKGGSYRKWYGNNEFLVNWANNGLDLKNFKDRNGKLLSRPQNEATYFKEGLTWTAISSRYFAVRYCSEGTIGSNAGMMIFSDNASELKPLLGLLNSSLATYLMSCLSQTLNFDQGIISKIPILKKSTSSVSNRLISIGKIDWDAYETSWDFAISPHLHPDHHLPTLNATYEKVRAYWRAMTLEMQRLEEENNRIFIDAYGLQDELTPDVPLSEITLSCNPHYRYGGNKTEAELETQLLTDTMEELISYAIGCMMGRYRLDCPGLIYAHSGNKDFEEIYHRKDAEDAKKEDKGAARQEKEIPLREAENPPLRSLRLCGENNSSEKTENLTAETQSTQRNKNYSASRLCGENKNLCGEFKPDEDGILPLMDMPWFADDAASRFVEFMKAAWPPENLAENLKFVSAALAPKQGEDPTDTIRRYLSTSFFKDHLKTYKKRPIYWLFSSGKQKAFECLVYLHRYNESTLSRMRSLYVTPLQGNIRSRIEFLEHEISAATSAADQRKFRKEQETLKKKQTELSAFDDQLRNFSDMRITLDLDDGVKVNYGKFGNLLAETKAITGE
ncbi:MAG: SAM-dependent methyltransferase, partial [Desulfobacterales bacterium CG23_combo_of_CG06-09_8_20_14_all_51_8]